MLSVIIPYAQEHPQIAFTVQSIYCELQHLKEVSGEDFEIIVIDNHCPELENQLAAKKWVQDGGSEYMKSLAGGHRPWLKYLNYTDKLSHWQAKNMGVQASKGDVLWFCDSHCIVAPQSLGAMTLMYQQNWQELHGTVHLPLAYMLDGEHPLIYKLVTDPDRAVYHYSFTRFKPDSVCYEVPAMSTCGMMMHRSIYDDLGGWPKGLGIYGGGENFINFTLAVLGYKKWIFPTKPLYHYAAKRGYNWNYDDFHRNRTISTLMYGTDELARKYAMNIKGNDLQKLMIYSSVVNDEETIAHSRMLRSKHVIPIEKWAREWQPEKVLD